MHLDYHHTDRQVYSNNKVVEKLEQNHRRLWLERFSLRMRAIFSSGQRKRIACRHRGNTS